MIEWIKGGFLFVRHQLHFNKLRSTLHNSHTHLTESLHQFPANKLSMTSHNQASARFSQRYIFVELFWPRAGISTMYLQNVSISHYQSSLRSSKRQDVQRKKNNDMKSNWKSLRFFTLPLICLVFHLRNDCGLPSFCCFISSSSTRVSRFLLCCPIFHECVHRFPEWMDFDIWRARKSVRWTVKTTETEGERKKCGTN